MRLLAVTTIAALAACVSVALAQEKRIALKEGPGLAQLQANCASCHSLDYIVMNSPFLDQKGWDAEVKKMINAYGAPIGADDAKAITEYLAANYGK
ncbi:MAG TPA: cytochrome c [Casimicrobiaceae bacterium]|jgi:mono/diheme cytochrome c family protein